MANITYRVNSNPAIPGTSIVKGAPLTNVEVDANFRAIDIEVDQLNSSTVRLTGDQTIAGVKAFSGQVNGKPSGTDTIPAFFAATTGGAYATMWNRRGVPFHAVSATVGSSYAPALSHQYTHNNGWNGVYSVGVLNHAEANAGSFVIHHLNSGATQDHAWHFNGANGEFISHGGITAVGAVNTQGNITAGGQFLGNGSVPPGAVMHFAMNSPPTGWLRANGAAVSRATFAALFAAIGTTYGAGDGSTTFNLPDLRGEFIRGLDDGRGVDSLRAFGSAQSFALQSHTHDVQISPGGAMQKFNSYMIGNNSFGSPWRPPTTDALGANVAAETRPRNVALLACIKF